MSYRLTAVLATSLFAAACGGGNTAASTTGGGATSGGTGTGTTTGGTAGQPLRDGQPCSANTDCSSGVCGVDGTGNCCHASCGDAGGACDATACDGAGACTFPASGSQCKADSCGGGRLTAFACDGVGNCGAGTPSTCSQHFGCTSDGTACATACTRSTECAQNYVCNDGACVGAKTVGPCTENDDCFSGHCGLDGGGHCCTDTAPCASGDPICGASDCDPTNGSCGYAGAGTACGSVLASCNGGVAQGASACDGKGACDTPGPAACTPFICGGNACLATCTDSSSCGAGDFCDTSHAICCTALASGATITVDSTAGNDAMPCCSVPGYGPCQTLTEAMKQIDAARAQSVILEAVVRNGKTWAPPGEVYPIVLGWGAELSAPNVFFYDGADAGNPELFAIQAVSNNDSVGYASIVGSGAGPVTIGDDEFRDQSSDPSIIKIAGGSTLYLANAQLDSTEFTDNTAITIAAGGGLVIAQDQPGTNLGTVTIGYSDINRESDWGYAGIVCQSSKTAGCTISDTVLDGGSSLVIQGQTSVDIDAEDFANVTLTGNPVIGIPAGDAGFGVCYDKVDAEDAESGAAVILNGTASVTFDNGFIQCISGDAFALNASKTGVPTLNLGNTTIENVNTAVDVFAGTATVTGSTIEFNGNGVAQTTNGINFGTVHLNGGDAGGNTIICSDSQEANGNIIGIGNGTAGTDVSNDTPNALDADNVTWDTSGPDLFRCDAAFETCTCQIASCTISTADGGVDGMDAVEIGDAGVISTAGHQLSSTACNFPPPIEEGCNPANPNSCGAGLICCAIIRECLPAIECP